MSTIEEDCRWTIVCAYVLWHLRHRPGRILNMLAYERALGLDFV
jgi:hypothetical protein